MPSAPPAFDSSYEPQSLAQHAYSAIRDQILKGELKLGAPLSRRKLAAELGVSLLPVAEALQRLETEGLVESRPRIGTRVCQPSADDIRGRYEVREALEAQAARLFAEKSSARERRELQQMAKQTDKLFQRCFDGATDPDFLYELHSHHARFHLRIVECTGCRLLQEALERNHVMIFSWLYDVAAQRPALPLSFHCELMEALSQGDPELADRAMRRHVRYGLQSVLHGISQRTVGSAEVRAPKKKVSKRRVSRPAKLAKSRRAT